MIRLVPVRYWRHLRRLFLVSNDLNLALPWLPVFLEEDRTASELNRGCTATVIDTVPTSSSDHAVNRFIAGLIQILVVPGAVPLLVLLLSSRN